MEYSDQYDIQVAYQHQLQRIAFNFICGPFGGVKGKILGQKLIASL